MSYLASLQVRLREKQEQLERLNNCVNGLNGVQSEFLQKSTLIHDPELTPTTWKGSLANTFHESRVDVDTEYKDISNNQLQQSLSTISSKIDVIQSEIESLYTSIGMERARLARLAREGD